MYMNVCTISIQQLRVYSIHHISIYSYHLLVCAQQMTFISAQLVMALAKVIGWVQRKI